jgi:hypothetical protein
VDSIGSILSTELHRGYFYVEGRMPPVSASGQLSKCD